METIGPIDTVRTGRILDARDMKFPSGRTSAIIASKSKPVDGIIRVGLYPPNGQNEIEFIEIPVGKAVVTRGAYEK